MLPTGFVRAATRVMRLSVRFSSGRLAESSQHSSNAVLASRSRASSVLSAKTFAVRPSDSEPYDSDDDGAVLDDTDDGDAECVVDTAAVVDLFDSDFVSPFAAACASIILSLSFSRRVSRARARAFSRRVVANCMASVLNKSRALWIVVPALPRPTATQPFREAAFIESIAATDAAVPLLGRRDDAARRAGSPLPPSRDDALAGAGVVVPIDDAGATAFADGFDAELPMSAM